VSASVAAVCAGREATHGDLGSAPELRELAREPLGADRCAEFVGEYEILPVLVSVARERLLKDLAVAVIA
jgi:hypothetical protein